MAMIEKRILDTLLKRVAQGGLTVTYWDGETRSYGPDPAWFKVTVNKPAVVRAMMRNLTLGFGEAYANGDIEVDGDLTQVGRLVSANSAAFGPAKLGQALAKLRQNTQRLQKSQIAHHYDLGNKFYKMWLDESMTYSCAYFRKPTDTLEQAQANKVDHLLKKLQLKKGMTLLDIGSGWGQLLFAAAEKYGVSGLGVTLSEEQYKHCVAEAKRRKLADKLTFRLVGYQELANEGLSFDRIISVGMFEHVGRDNQKDYFKVVHQLLKEGGVSVLHTISNQTPTSTDPWIDKYIFPGGYLPAATQLFPEVVENGFRLMDYENLRLHYSMTLDEWLKRFTAHKKQVVKMLGEDFFRMWSLYLAGSSASFRYGDLDLTQLVFSKGLNNDLKLTREHIYR